MTRIIPIARTLLGLVFVTFALNYFIPFLPAQEPPPADALPFIGAFVGSGYMTLVKVIELTAGVLLLSNRFVPLAAALLAPIIVGITAFHVLLVPAGLGMAIGLIVLELTVAWGYRAAFAPMLRAKVTPAVPVSPPHVEALARCFDCWLTHRPAARIVQCIWARRFCCDRGAGRGSTRREPSHLPRYIACARPVRRRARRLCPRVRRGLRPWRALDGRCERLRAQRLPARWQRQ